MIDPARREQSVAFGLERRGHGRGHQPRGRLKQLQLETIGIGPRARGPGAGHPEAGPLERRRHARPVVHRGQDAVVADRRLPLPRGTDSDVADLSIGGQIAEQDEVAQRVADGLLMKRGFEDSRVEAR